MVHFSQNKLFKDWLTPISKESSCLGTCSGLKTHHWGTFFRYRRSCVFLGAHRCFQFFDTRWCSLNHPHFLNVWGCLPYNFLGGHTLHAIWGGNGHIDLGGFLGDTIGGFQYALFWFLVWVERWRTKLNTLLKIWKIRTYCTSWHIYFSNFFTVYRLKSCMITVTCLIICNIYVRLYKSNGLLLYFMILNIHNYRKIIYRYLLKLFLYLNL